MNIKNQSSIKYTKIRNMEIEFIKDWTEGILTKKELIEKYECPYTNIKTRARELDISRSKLEDKIDVNALCKDYENGMSAKDLRDKYKICFSSVIKLLTPLGVVRKVGLSSRKYDINEHYFDNIDTETKAYYLGLFFADGYNHESKGSLTITLKEEDKNIIERLFKEIDYSRPIIKTHNDLYNKDYVMGQISSRYLSNKFAEYGCMKNKTFDIRFPSWLNISLQKHFIRGYFDGDGGISIPKVNLYKTSVNFAGNYEFLYSIQKILMEECDINETKLYNAGSIFTLVISGKFQVLRVLKYLYENSTIYLERKYKKYLKIIQEDIFKEM